ncbi:MAG: hypothetical protein Aureis2KO_21350 [Aureisphaera sp.]
MIFNTTHRNDEDKEIIDQLMGKAYTLWQSIKIGGTGSKRMIIEEVSSSFTPYLNTVADINYGNIELRPNGILIHIAKGLKNFTWAIPYYKLVVFKTNGISFHANGDFIRFKGNVTYKENKRFIDKLMTLKLEFNQG